MIRSEQFYKHSIKFKIYSTNHNKLLGHIDVDSESITESCLGKYDLDMGLGKVKVSVKSDELAIKKDEDYNTLFSV